MFLDEKELLIKAGKGGDGVILFRHEKYVPRGGPDGGDGGNGGSVILLGQRNLHALAHLSYTEKIEAEEGDSGGHRRSSGKAGKDTTLLVPLGTVVLVENPDTKEWETLVEITDEDQSFILAKGGSGGWGNWHFRSSIQQAPQRANPGLSGETKKVKLVLKLIADVGLVGLPNAGKSTFLSVVSSARPKIADYPFTTLEPQLGVVMIPYKDKPLQLVIADLPGIIEGASQGKGLGAAFLKHIERTRTILHFLSATDEIEELKNNYCVIRKELESWSQALTEKPELIVLSKIDTISEDEVQDRLRALEKLSGKKVYPISAVAGQGVTALLQAVSEMK